MVGLEWARSFDWEYWQESSKSLQASHPTVARDYDPVRWDGQNSERGGCREIKALYQRLFKRFIAEVRRRGYSIRTEQTYATWICHFIAFHGKGDSASMGPQEVLGFLEYLA